VRGELVAQKMQFIEISSKEVNENSNEELIAKVKKKLREANGKDDKN
jgi:hypothetical protein